MRIPDRAVYSASAQADILVLTSSFPRHSGDLSAPFLKELCENLQAGCQKPIHILAPADDRSCVSPQSEETLQFHRFNYLSIPEWQKLAYGAGIPDNLIRSPWLISQIPFFLRAFYCHAERLAPQMDLLHCHWIFPAGWIGMLIKRKYPSLKLVVSIHSSDLELLEKIPYGKNIFRSIVSAADHLTVVNFSQACKVKKIMGRSLLDPKINVLPMGVHRPECRKPRVKSDSFKVLFLGRFIPIKGLRYLLEACENLTGVEVLAAGEGPEKRFLEKRFFRNVRFLGAVSGEQKKNLFASADLAVFPSIPELWRTEGTPVSLLECLAEGIPVIASATGGMKEVIRHGQNGILVKPGSISELRAAILKLKNHFELRENLGIRAYQDSEGYDWNTISQKFHEIFNRVLTARLNWMS